MLKLYLSIVYTYVGESPTRSILAINFLAGKEKLFKVIEELYKPDLKKDKARKQVLIE